MIGREDRRSFVRSVTRRSGVRFRSGTKRFVDPPTPASIRRLNFCEGDIS